MTPLVESDPTERISPDDMATRRDAEFLQRALLQQRHAAALVPAGVPGICMNCDEQCLPLAVYCDEHCRTDHEARERSSARMRTSLG